jgi:predicted metal-dependent phosphoesterase TrpH
VSEPTAAALERIDLHTHSDCSDGSLSPSELVRLAAMRGVTLLALTDHDTTAGLAEAQAACARHGIGFVTGIELSCRWRDSEIHVLGLGFDATHAELAALCDAQLARRRVRISAMATRLAALGLPGDALARSALRAASPTRAHLAQSLHEHSFADSPQDAFDRYLAPGKPGYVPAAWPTMGEILACIRNAGGIAVLAHPHRYGLSAARRLALVSEFKALGGEALEISVTGMSPAEGAAAEQLARRFGLAGSTGSDFHQPGLPWRPLGRFAKLAEAVTPITVRLAARLVQLPRGSAEER